MHLSLARALDGRRALPVLDGTRLAAAGLDAADRLVRLDVTVRDLAEDDVLAVEPAGDDGGDEELRAVAARSISISCMVKGELTYVFGPALAMDRRKGLVCASLKFSSANFSP